jgi:hypothetical protein
MRIERAPGLSMEGGMTGIKGRGAFSGRGRLVCTAQLREATIGLI